MKELLEHFDGFLENRMFSVEKHAQKSIKTFDESYNELRNKILTQCSEAHLCEFEDLLISNLAFQHSHYYRQGFFDGFKLLHHILTTSDKNLQTDN